MSVPFRELEFRNNNGIAVNLTVQAPVGTTVYGPTSVGSMSTVNVNPNVNNCPSVLLIASDPHGDYRQSFATATPSSGLPVYLEKVHVSYVIASFRGSISARTDTPMIVEGDQKK